MKNTSPLDVKQDAGRPVPPQPISSIMSSLSITSINGKRCTAVPRTNTGGAAAQTIALSSSTTAPEVAATSSTTEAAAVTPAAVPAVASSPDATTAASETAATAAPAATSTTAAQLQPAATTAAVAANDPTSEPTTTSTAAESTFSDTGQTDTDTAAVATTATEASSLETSSVAGSSPATQLTSDGATTSVSTNVAATANAQSELDGFTSISSVQSAIATTSVPLPAQTGSTTTASIHDPSSGQGNNIGAIAGGTIGGVALIALVSLLLWWFRKRRRSRRDSLLTPLTTPFPPDPSGYYGKIDESYASPSRSEKLKARLDTFNRNVGVSLRDKLSRKSSARINLDRGNSQFINPTPISQHSRNNSTASSLAQPLTLQERVGEWWTRAREMAGLRLRRQRIESFPTPPPNNEKSSHGPPKDFETFLAHQGRASQFATGPMKLSLDFSKHDSRQPTVPNFSQPSPSMNVVHTSEPTQPSPMSTRIRTLSTSQNNRSLSPIIETASNKSIPSLGRPYSLASSQFSSDRSTFMTTFSDARSKKGRSDPFDLSPPDIAYLNEPMPGKSGQMSNMGHAAQHRQRSSNTSDFTPPTGLSSLGASHPNMHLRSGPTSTLLDSVDDINKRARESRVRRSKHDDTDRGRAEDGSLYSKSNYSVWTRDDIGSAGPRVGEAR